MDIASVLRPDYIPSTQQTIPPTQYGPAHHSQYMGVVPNVPYLAQHDPNNNAYIGPVYRPQSHISIQPQESMLIMFSYIISATELQLGDTQNR